MNCIDGLGYYDDGEEHVFDPEEDANKKQSKIRTGAHATLSANANALKKARKANELLESASLNKQQKGSMWSFVKRGASAATINESSQVFDKKNSAMSAAKLDSLLAALDDPLIPSRSSTTLSRGRSLAFNSRPSNPPARSFSLHDRKRPYEHTMPNHDSYSTYTHEENGFDHGQNDADFHTFEAEELVEPMTDANVEEHPADSGNSGVKEHSVAVPAVENTATEQTAQESAILPAVTTKRLGFVKKSKLGQNHQPPNSSAAKVEIDVRTAQQEEHKQVSSSIMSVVALGAQPDNISGNEAVISTHIDANLENLLQKDTSDKSYIDFFYLDAFEKNGVVSLFGKIQATPNDFVSACVIVHNNVRNLFVLPRPGASMVDVHKEITSVLKPSCIPVTAGATFAAKPVMRKYAFDDSSVPRQETQYLKVKYDAKYGVPSEKICEDGGQYFAKIFNSGASPLEAFIIKRKLMGPSWIRIYNPTSTSDHSWCKLEVQVSSPKNVIPLRLLDEEKNSASNKATPPVKVVSLKLKTVINPTKKTSEIVVVSAICHHNIMLDTSSDYNCMKNVVALTMVRPLGQGVADQNDGLAQFPHNLDHEIECGMPQLQPMPNERAMLNRLFTQIGIWDPDVIVGHNAWGFDMDVLLARCITHKVPSWSKVGRRRVTTFPSQGHFGHQKDWAIVEAMTGRILCDTYLSAQELLRETTYSLKSLAETQLRTNREDIDPVDVPQFFNSCKTIVQLARHTLLDSQLVLKLMLKLQILPLTKQLTCIAGNVWARTMKGNRAERNEYLLLHEFHKLKYIVPEKRKNNAKRGGRAAAKYSGGLVLEPKKGLYDSFILLLDFNSLYPSIIQEYNLCFTTVEWSSYKNNDGAPASKGSVKGVDEEDNYDEEDEEKESSLDKLPLAPSPSEDKGVLPRVIKTLVERRGIVKNMLKNEKDPDKRGEVSLFLTILLHSARNHHHSLFFVRLFSLLKLDIRQKALKLTANAMYGCLGFSHSRFYAKPIAAMVTAFGRETLQRAVQVAEDALGLDVIYGDTDSIMINTRITNIDDFSKVLELGSKVKREVNKMYKTLELEVDGVFKPLLLLKKKKYAAVKVSQATDGTFTYEKEMKGLDLVRRDWCIQSKETGRFVLDQILSGRECELVVDTIHQHLEELASKMRNDELPLDKYVITKGLSKHPNDYPDGKSQPHVNVAKSMILHNRPVNIGDHIPFVITLLPDPIDESNPETQPKKLSYAERARHPEEILRSAGALKPDIEWYLTQQILPPIVRLCEPITGTSQSIIAEKLGLDTSKFRNEKANHYEEDDLLDYTPAMNLSDEERFKDVEKLLLTCEACGEQSEYHGAIHLKDGKMLSGLCCSNPNCVAPNLWGASSLFEVFAIIYNEVLLNVQKFVRRYYRGILTCDEMSCALETTQQSVLGDHCLARGCMGRLKPKYTETALYNQLKYYHAMFDIDHACNQLEKSETSFGSRNEMKSSIPPSHLELLANLRQTTQRYLSLNAYNFIEPNIWVALFGKASGGKTSQ